MKRVNILAYVVALTFTTVDAQTETELTTSVSDSERLDRLEDIVEQRERYTPQIHGAIRSRWEGEFGHDGEPFAQRFQVRNARLQIEGDVMPDVSYYVRVDACDRGEFKFLDAWINWRFLREWGVQAGQFRIPYGIDCFRSAGTYIFANRSFNQKYLLNMRNVGVRFGYYPSKIPMTVEAGVFNSTNTSDHDRWQRSVNFAAKATWRVGDVTVSASTASVEPDSVRINLLCAGATYSSGRWLVEGEIQNRHYTNGAHKATQGWDIFGKYTIPFSGKGIIDEWDFELRYDGMTDFSSGIRNENGVLVTDESRRQRLTVGTQIAHIRTPLKVLVRLNYEHYFYPSSVVVPRGDGNKIVAELVVKF